jgi:predicted ATPase
MTLWHLGYPDQALQRSYEALALAQTRDEPHVLVNALGYAALVHQGRRDVRATYERAEMEMELASQHGFVFFLAEATLLRGWALVEQGQEEEGIVQLREGLAAWRTAGAEIMRPYYLGWLAGAYGRVGQADAGLDAVAEALPLVDHSGEGRWEAELHRLRGELILRKCQISDFKVQVVPVRPAPSGL